MGAVLSRSGRQPVAMSRTKSESTVHRKKSSNDDTHTEGGAAGGRAGLLQSKSHGVRVSLHHVLGACNQCKPSNGSMPMILQHHSGDPEGISKIETKVWAFCSRCSPSSDRPVPTQLISPSKRDHAGTGSKVNSQSIASQHGYPRHPPHSLRAALPRTAAAARAVTPLVALPHALDRGS